ncbi:MAG: hypothetical protein K6G61_12065 [Solobacterium sp.]|nr:hypothetical protein [Solobacterium sp.]
MLRILMYALMFYMILRIITLNAVNKRNKGLIDIVNSVNDKEAFFTRISEAIENAQDATYAAKARVLKLWGMAYHDEFFGFEKTLEELNPGDLLTVNKDGSTGIGQEDSFFYLYLGIPNILYMNKQDEYRKMLREKVSEYDEKLSDQIVKVLGDSCDLYYDQKDDKGQSFFQRLLEGDYAEYVYAKSLIGLYKSIAETMLARIYKDIGDEEKFEGTLDGLRYFNSSGIGARWIRAMDLTSYLEEKKEEEALAEESSEEETAEEDGSEENKEDAE